MINRKKSINGFSRSIAFNEDGIARESEGKCQISEFITEAHIYKQLDEPPSVRWRTAEAAAAERKKPKKMERRSR